MADPDIKAKVPFWKEQLVRNSVAFMLWGADKNKDGRLQSQELASVIKSFVQSPVLTCGYISDFTGRVSKTFTTPPGAGLEAAKEAVKKDKGMYDIFVDQIQRAYPNKDDPSKPKIDELDMGDLGDVLGALSVELKKCAAKKKKPDPTQER